MKTLATRCYKCHEAIAAVQPLKRYSANFGNGACECGGRIEVVQVPDGTPTKPYYVVKVNPEQEANLKKWYEIFYGPGWLLS
jgi:hypothetical protein